MSVSETIGQFRKALSRPGLKPIARAGMKHNQGLDELAILFHRSGLF
jgi:hypothetical protein